ncbi:hypothetical protein NN561_017491 [Cricetulus griseus]
MAAVCADLRESEALARLAGDPRMPPGSSGAGEGGRVLAAADRAVPGTLGHLVSAWGTPGHTDRQGQTPRTTPSPAPAWDPPGCTRVRAVARQLRPRPRRPPVGRLVRWRLSLRCGGPPGKCEGRWWCPGILGGGGIGACLGTLLGTRRSSRVLDEVGGG